MTDYEPGTVAVATVRGVPNVRAFREGAHSVYPWRATGIGAASEHEVTDVRPLVVLDLHIKHALDLAAWLRGQCTHDSIGWKVADQIEAQTRPPKPAEPQGLGAVVRDRRDLQWVRVHPGGKAWVNGYETWREWDDIDVVEVLSEGVR